MKIKSLLTAVTTSVVLGFWAASASATLIFNIDTGNNAITGTGPYATVSVTAVDPNTANIVFDSLTNGGYIYLMGDGGTADLNVNGAYTLGAVTELNSVDAGFTPTFKDNTPGQVNGFGVFNLSLNNTDGFTDSATQISFQLTNTTGLWTSDALVLTLNSNGAVAAIHVFACAEPGCSTSSGAAFTGFAAGNGSPVGCETDCGPPPQEIPEPAMLSLLGIGLLGLSLTAMRRRKL